MNNNQIEKVAFVSGSMLCLAEETDRTLCHLTQLVGIDALEEIGTAIAELVDDLEPVEGAEANALFAILCSQTIAELVEGGLGKPERAEIREAYLAEMAERRKEASKHDLI